VPQNLSSLLVVAAVAVLAPIVADYVPRVRLPVVVLELLLGIIVGPQVLGFASTGGIVDTLSTFGLAFLFFLAGLEIDFHRVRGRPLELAGVGWLVSAAVGFGIAAILQAEGAVVSTLVIGLCLVTTSLGTLMPILKDGGLVDTRFGTYVIGAGTIGEFAPIVLVSLLLGVDRAGEAAVLLGAFTAIAAAAAVLALRWRPTRIIVLIERTMKESGQLAVRLSWLVLVLLLWVTTQFGLDVILGAFAAGLVVGLVSHGREAEPLRVRLHAIGFGLFVPIFFVTSGMSLDVDALFANVSTMIRVPVFLGLLLLARGLPTLLYRRDLPRHDLVPFGLMSATALPLIVAITQIAAETGRIKAENAAALVGAGILSVLIFPLSALALRRDTSTRASIVRSAPATSAERAET
jgi:Kef-type K+ transport system membrane component KefB